MSRAGPRRPGPVLWAAAGFGFLLLLAPAFVVGVVSFSSGQYLSFPPPGLSLRWYEALFANQAILSALVTSAILAAIVAGIALLVGVPAAYAIARLEFPGRRLLSGILLGPLLLPSLVIGLALLLALQPLKLVATWPGLALAHCTIAVPFAVRIMITAIAAVPPELEAAARTLGASPLRAALRITLPLAAPGVFASAALAFLISFDETVISLFLVGPRLTTLPVELFRYADNRSDPLVAALSMVLIVIALAIILLVERIAGFSRTLSKD
jgi:putative spermidine/putrescine transport system permease protein